ncbi:hypothetical protein [Chryseobacterium sp.]|uniref:hypothetical protein n=1 Tax=Chryseobacterium sp. TaxID=1871047 RepID=UPI0025BB219A|nr:hypothetical protein [Chryseobacterium sp.]
MKSLKYWLCLCLFNFFVVSLLGVMMRYNIAFSLPGFNHKYMQESHSHFAFYGWVSACLYLFVTHYLTYQSPSVNILKYRWVMIFNQIGSYGMLFSFLYGGYYWLSIAFSSVALFSGFFFFAFLLLDTKRNQAAGISWLRAGSFFATLSSLGIFGLAYISASKMMMDELHRASIYFYLHFQYNGFFFFSCIGLLLLSLEKFGMKAYEKTIKISFYLLFYGTFLGYGLSLLWIPVPNGLYVFFVLVAIVQLVGVWKLWVVLGKYRKVFTENGSGILKLTLGVALFALLSKFIFQFLSVIPQIGLYVFNTLNIVIAYLHWVLLVGISMFLIWKIFEIKVFRMTAILRIFIGILLTAILLNELFLGVSGLFSIYMIPFRSGAQLLLGASIMITVSILGILFSLKYRENLK